MGTLPSSVAAVLNLSSRPCLLPDRDVGGGFRDRTSLVAVGNKSRLRCCYVFKNGAKVWEEGWDFFTLNQLIASQLESYS